MSRPLGVLVAVTPEALGGRAQDLLAPLSLNWRHAGTARRSRICSTTSRLTTFSDGVRGNSLERPRRTPATCTWPRPRRRGTPAAPRASARSAPALGDDRRARALAQPLVRQRHDRHLVHRRMAQDDRLDLGRHDRHAAAADDVLAAPDVDEVAVLVERPEIAGAVAAPVASATSRVSSSLLRNPRKRLGPLTITVPTVPAGTGSLVVRRRSGSRCRRTGDPRCG